MCEGVAAAGCVYDALHEVDGEWKEEEGFGDWKGADEGEERHHEVAMTWSGRAPSLVCSKMEERLVCP